MTDAVGVELLARLGFSEKGSMNAQLGFKLGLDEGMALLRLVGFVDGFMVGFELGRTLGMVLGR